MVRVSLMPSTGFCAISSRWFIKPAFPSRPMEPVFAADLDEAAKLELKARIKAQPHDFVAQEQVALSHVPVWEHGTLDSRSMVLRAYVLNTGRGWMVMPGGLVRVAAEGGSVVSMQRGGHSKDAWVLSEEPVDTFSMLRPRNASIVEVGRETSVPSGVALNVYWLGRYVERAEWNDARFAHHLVAISAGQLE